MCHQKLLILITILSSSLLLCSCHAKPVFGPIGVSEKHKIAKMLESERKSLQELEDEQALLERVVETLSKEIEDKEAHIEQLRSYTHGRSGIVGTLNDFYHSNYKNGPASRPGR
uniref:Uncharacterized protein n=1 Tax=Caenorhabditis japonica TaxID=281687 RepID=A0A8R1HSM8_CAEJA